MAKTFNFSKRSAELIKQGVSDDEAVEVLMREADESDFTILDKDWLSQLKVIEDNAEKEYQESLKTQRTKN